MKYTIKPETKIFSETEWESLSNFEKEVYVKKECESIKRFFAKEEIDKLHPEIIDGDSISRCVYGIITGDCNSKKAARFICNHVDVMVSNYDINTEIPEANLRGAFFTTALEQYISPKEDDYCSEEDCKEDYIFTDEYFNKIEKIVKWLKE